MYSHIIGYLANAIINSKPKLNVLHIGKTGGTNLIEAGIGFPKFNDQVRFRLREKIFWNYRARVIGHEDVPSSLSKENLAFFIREPLSRYESAFWYEKNWRFSEYEQIIKQNPDVTALFEVFLTFHDWLLAFSDPNHEKHFYACELKKKSYHLHRDYTFYFRDVDVIEKMEENVIFIGETEEYESDLARLCKILGVRNASPLSMRRNKSKKPTNEKLSSVARSRFEKSFSKEYDLYRRIKDMK